MVAGPRDTLFPYGEADERGQLSLALIGFELVALQIACAFLEKSS